MAADAANARAFVAGAFLDERISAGASSRATGVAVRVRTPSPGQQQLTVNVVAQNAGAGSATSSSSMTFTALNTTPESATGTVDPANVCPNAPTGAPSS